MGCCFSTPNGPNAPYPGGAPPSSSARAINSPRLVANIGANEEAVRSPRSPHSHSEDMRSVRRNARRQHQQHHQQPLSQHIDKPLRRHTWVAKNRVWTRPQLARERADFFDTRVTGRPEVWQTIRGALEVMWEADAAARITGNNAAATPANENEGGSGVEPQGGNANNDTALATAQSILKAAEVTLPTGNLANGVYDALGTYYAVPEWIVCDPVNVAEGGSDADHDDPKANDEGDLTGGEETAEDIDEEEALRRREEKGKAVADVRDLIKIRARLSENSRDIILTSGTNESVRSVIRKIKEEANLSPNKSVRLSYMGRILKEGTSLLDQGFQKGHVVNAFVYTR
ncbi:ubiquitin domain-containing protein [Apiospora marii]|uniref:Ubiquitin domain-containing protein n=1 Tax=Apiospora marii TaxID=335849 RepID=A0ABR1RV31_9PEZI